jgi:hypothetical protein
MEVAILMVCNSMSRQWRDMLGVEFGHFISGIQMPSWRTEGALEISGR